MNLTPELREQVRLSILRYCLRPTRTGLVRANLRGEGFALDLDTVQLELDYLHDKGLLKPNDKRISPENKFWQTTAAGRDELALQKEETA